MTRLLFAARLAKIMRTALPLPKKGPLLRRVPPPASKPAPRAAPKAQQPEQPKAPPSEVSLDPNVEVWDVPSNPSPPAKSEHPLYSKLDKWHRVHLQKIYQWRVQQGLKDSFDVWLSTSPNVSMMRFMDWFARQFREWHRMATAGEDVETKVGRMLVAVVHMSRMYDLAANLRTATKVYPSYSDQLDIVDACKAVLPKNADGYVCRERGCLRLNVLPKHVKKALGAVKALRRFKVKHGPYTAKEAKKNGLDVHTSNRDPQVYIWFEYGY